MKEIMIIILLIYSSLKAQHYNVVEPTGLPYQIIITGIKINNQDPCLETEIGVFDDTLCVGSAKYQGEYNLPITAWEGSSIYNLKGFESGHNIKFRLWTEMDGEWYDILANPSFESGSGLFGSGLFSIVKLDVDIPVSANIEKSKIDAEEINLEVYPNPTTKLLNVKLKFAPKGNYSVAVYNLLGELVNLLDKGSADLIEKSIFWNGSSLSGSKIASGIYLIAVKTNRSLITKKVLFVH